MNRQNVQLLIGGAGFIGTSLAAKLCGYRTKIVVVDNDSSLNLKQFESQFSSKPNVQIIERDINSKDAREILIANLSTQPVDIWHLAANSDIRSGSFNPHLDAVNTFQTSVSVCSLLEFLNVSSVNFASTSAVYGELHSDIPFSEDSICDPISYYGISKLASEKFLKLACDRLGISLLVFRFANIVGTPATHGILLDLMKKIIENPKSLEVLGDGNQVKTYSHVDSLISMMIKLKNAGISGVFNLGPGDKGITVKEIVDTLIAHLEIRPMVNYGSSPRGWFGDSVNSRMANKKYTDLMNEKVESSASAIHLAIHEVADQLSLDIACKDESFR